jgi:hypothetical protein
MPLFWALIEVSKCIKSTKIQQFKHFPFLGISNKAPKIQRNCYFINTFPGKLAKGIEAGGIGLGKQKSKCTMLKYRAPLQMKSATELFF